MLKEVVKQQVNSMWFKVLQIRQATANHHHFIVPKQK
jgi:hypothetical protein